MPAGENYTTMTPCSSRGRMPFYIYVLELGLAVFVMTLSQMGIWAGLVIITHALYRLANQNLFQGICPNCKAIRKQLKENGKAFKCKSCKHQIGIHGLKMVDLSEGRSLEQVITNEVSEAAKKDEKIGKHPEQLVNAIGGFLVMGIIVWFLVSGDSMNNPILNKAKDDVARDAVNQYRIVERHGNKIDKCVHAGLVAAAYIQANDEANYTRWKVVRDNDCKNAGMPVQ